MHLKRLEMVGFKSFAERTRLDFQPGITAIIGPNGCGKSNVVDAIRWCLGEMSAKSLRSKVLLDVIFNGSANRAPTNLSEVSLTFDNSQNRLPIDYSEVTVTRRLFRSGESEYFLNKTQCRLKDIKELFLDTGIGEEGYSIMEQGRVEYILNARPEERRELFEEAAGVSKYKARREEALRKMERAQIDLDRLSDVIAMTKEQMDKLDAAVRKARQYQKMQDELKIMEVSHWLWEISQLDAELASLKESLRVLEDASQAKTAEIAGREAELADLRVTEIRLGEELVAVNRRLSEIDGAIVLAEQSHRHAEERIAEVLARDAQLDAEMAEADKRLAELGDLRPAVEAELRMEREQAAGTGEALRAAEENHRALLERQKAAEEESHALQAKLWESNRERGRLQNDAAHRRSLAARLELEIKALKKDKEQAEEKIRSAGAARETAARENADRRYGLSGLEENARAAQAAREEAERRLAEADALSASLQERFFSAKAQREAHAEREAGDPYAQGRAAVLSAGLPGIQGPLGKLLDVLPVDEPVVRRVLGDHLNDLLADSLEDARAAVAFLADGKKGRARFLVLDRIPSVEAPSGPAPVGQRAVLDLIRCDDRLRPALRFLAGRWVAGGHTLYGEGVLEGGADFAPPREADALRLENLGRELDAAQSALESARREKTAREAERAAAASADEAASRALETARVQAEVYRQEEDRHASLAELGQKELDLIEEEIRRASAEDEQAQASARDMDARLAELTAAEEDLRVRWQAAHEALRVRQEETSAAGASLAAARERAGHQSQRVAWQEKRLADADAESAALTASLESKRGERAVSGEKIEEQKRVQAESRASVESRADERRETERSLEDIHARRQAHHDRSAAASTAVDALREEAERLRAEHEDKKIRDSHARAKRESLETRMKEKYGFDAAEAAQSHGSPAAPADAAALDRLRRRVESMGPVNLAAPEEHTQLEERYNFLLTQQQDIIKAKEDLMRTIQKINATTRESFRETFEKVRENFKALYGRLFEGGEADLRFTDPEDVLNTGVEIYAQPPGKKLQNITLLSGGEKALTAVSLLFAFFMVRPSPFCVLDEVDAPLDEANVMRFVSLLRAFTQQSQFILITHNKRSMETADTLYGVTMETLGVSKILSARLKKEAPAEMVEAK
ncbi:MAG: AAA family ATPase [Elusimicrobiota bacterium]